MPQDRFVTRVVGLTIVAILAYLVVRIFRPFAGPIVWAFLVAFLFFPVVTRLRRRFGGRRALVALLVTIGVILVLVLPAAALAAAFGGQAVELVQRLRGLAESYQIRAPEDLLTIPIVGQGIAWLDTVLPFSAAQIQTWSVKTLQSAVQFLLSHSGAVVAGAFGVFGSVTLMLFVLFFFLRDGDEMAERVIRLIPMDADKKARLFRHLGDVTRAVVFGTLVTALVQGTLIGLAFWITGLSSPVVFGSLAFIASFIPFVGTSLVVVPAVLYLLVQGVLWKVIFFALWGMLVVGTADNFLRPALVSGRAEIGTLTAFFGVIGGIGAFGVIGLFLGPVVLALVLALLAFAEENRAGAAAPAPAAVPRA
jgi:predicted PurR-regulated permease PerM